MAIKSLILLPLMICFLVLAGQGIAASPDDYLIVVNGTVTCSGYPSAEVGDIEVTLFVKQYLVEDAKTNSMGQFVIRVKDISYIRSFSPADVSVEVYPTLEQEKACPSGLKGLQVAEAYARVNLNYSVVGVRIFANGTRQYSLETLKTFGN